MKLLLTSTRGPGHLHPLLPLARAARRAGDEVSFAVPAALAEIVQKQGYAAIATPPGDDGGDAIGRRLPHLRRAIDRRQPDVVVSALPDLAGPLAAEAAGVSHALLGTSALRVGDVGPDLLAAPLDRARLRLGLPAEEGIDWLFRNLYATPFPAVLEHPDLVRPATTLAYRHQDPDGTRPVLHLGRPPTRRGRPVIHASLGTLVSETASRARPTEARVEAFQAVLAGLGLVDADVLFAVGGLDREVLGLVPRNVRLAGQVAPAVAMACDAVLTDAAAGTLTAALTRGLPLVCVPLVGDQPHNARRAAEVGAGLALASESGPREIAAALEDVIGEESYRRASQGVARDLAALPPVEDVLAGLHALPGRVELIGRAAG